MTAGLRAKPKAPPARSARAAMCCWPIGEPGTREFHFCDAPINAGSPYCEPHHKIAYVKLPNRREADVPTPGTAFNFSRKTDGSA